MLKMNIDMISIDSLPDEVLEFIISKVSPYGDLKACRLTCHRWNACSKNVVRKRQADFTRSIQEMRMHWSACTNASTVAINDTNSENLKSPTIDSPTEKPKGLTVGKRYSHSAVYDDITDSMYIFGGCTSTATTFNDLWRLDLTTRRWHRPMATGTYPSPKACSVLVKYNNKLILFGGWTHPSMYPLHRWRLFNELHSYDLETCTWTQLLTPPQGAAAADVEDILRPPTMAGHSATIHRGMLIVFGGLQKQRNSIGQFSSSSDVWSFNLERMTWVQEDIPEPRPTPRYGQSQLYLDEAHILVLGGCGGPSNIFNDVWLLTIGQSSNADQNISRASVHWKWNRCRVENSLHGANHMWCHPAVRVGDFAVMLGKNRLPKQQNIKADKASESNKRIGSDHVSHPGNQSSSSNQHQQARWNVIPQLRRGVNRGYGAIRRPQLSFSGPNTHQNFESPSTNSIVDRTLEEKRNSISGDRNIDTVSSEFSEPMAISDDEHEPELSVISIEDFNAEPENSGRESTRSPAVFRACVNLSVNSYEPIESKSKNTTELETRSVKSPPKSMKQMDDSPNASSSNTETIQINESKSILKQEIKTDICQDDSLHLASNTTMAKSQNIDKSDYSQHTSFEASKFKIPPTSKDKMYRDDKINDAHEELSPQQSIRQPSSQNSYRQNEQTTKSLSSISSNTLNYANPSVKSPDAKLRPKCNSNLKVSAISFNRNVAGHVGTGI